MQRPEKSTLDPSPSSSSKESTFLPFLPQETQQNKLIPVMEKSDQLLAQETITPPDSPVKQQAGLTFSARPRARSNIYGDDYTHQGTAARVHRATVMTERSSIAILELNPSLHPEFRKEELVKIQEMAEKFQLKDMPVLGWGFSVWDWTQNERLGITFGILGSVQLTSILKLSQDGLFRFMLDIQKGYCSTNPYHSFLHGLDVLQFSHYLLTDIEARQYLNPLDSVALMVAALCHDIEHPGFNNLFQVNTKSPLVQLYGDQSVLEHHSAACTIALLEKHNAFHALTTNQGERFRTLIRESILSTDMACHFELLEQFSAFVEQANGSEREISKGRNGSSQTPLGARTFEDFSDEERLLIVSVLLHGADISNACRPWDICKRWSDLVVEEFFRQGDQEKALQLPISPNMDRDSTDQSQISVGFNDFVVRPFFIVLIDLLPGVNILIDSLTENRDRWEMLEANESTQGRPALQSILDEEEDRQAEELRRRRSDALTGRIQPVPQSTGNVRSPIILETTSSIEELSDAFQISQSGSRRHSSLFNTPPPPVQRKRTLSTQEGTMARNDSDSGSHLPRNSVTGSMMSSSSNNTILSPIPSNALRRLSLAAGIVTIPENFLNRVHSTTPKNGNTRKNSHLSLSSQSMDTSRTSIHSDAAQSRMAAVVHDSRMSSIKNLVSASNALRSLQQSPSTGTSSTPTKRQIRKRHSFQGGNTNTLPMGEKRRLLDRWNDAPEDHEDFGNSLKNMTNAETSIGELANVNSNNANSQASEDDVLPSPDGLASRSDTSKATGRARFFILQQQHHPSLRSQSFTETSPARPESNTNTFSVHSGPRRQNSRPRHSGSMEGLFEGAEESSFEENTTKIKLKDESDATGEGTTVTRLGHSSLPSIVMLMSDENTPNMEMVHLSRTGETNTDGKDALRLSATSAQLLMNTSPPSSLSSLSIQSLDMYKFPSTDRVPPSPITAQAKADLLLQHKEQWSVPDEGAAARRPSGDEEDTPTLTRAQSSHGSMQALLNQVHLEEPEQTTDPTSSNKQA